MHRPKTSLGRRGDRGARHTKRKVLMIVAPGARAAIAEYARRDVLTTVVADVMHEEPVRG